MRFLRRKFISYVIGSLTLCVLIFHSVLDKYTSSYKVSSVKLKYVVVHLDLKGSPPKLSYVAGLLPLFRRLGVNGLLMEYEDTFPYDGVLTNLSSTMPYNRIELKSFLKRSNAMNIEVIPLIQTFGHMEHALKLKQYKHLREVRWLPDSICPSIEGSVNLIKEMLHQVITFHNSITPLKHIHIGCDEVYQLNKCRKCRKKKLENRYIFLNHINTVKSLINKIDSHISILMWDDMLRKIRRPKWDENFMASLENIQPVYWDYTPNLAHVTHMDLFRYHKSFRNIWIASAFKGADGRQASLPILKYRLRNHYSWLNFILNYVYAGEKDVYNFKGIILTGWSRYSHLDPLCELLPSSLTSLVMNLLLIQRFRNGITATEASLTLDKVFDQFIAKKLSQELLCDARAVKYDDIQSAIETCKYKSNTLVTALKRYQVIKDNIESTFNNSMAIVSLVQYYSQIRNLNVKEAEKSVKWCKKMIADISRWESDASLILLQYYQKFVVDEYVGYYTYSVKKRIKSTLWKLQGYLKRDIWERRSYNYSFT